MANIRKFSELPLGTRFRYLGHEYIWVVLDNSGFGKIAHWTGVNQSVDFQMVGLAANTMEEFLNLEVEVLD